MNFRDKKSWKLWIQILLLVLSLAYIAHFFIRNLNTLQLTFQMDFQVLLLIILLQLLFFVLQSCRLKIVIEKCAETRLPFFYCLKVFILGRFLNLLFSQFGNVYRGVRLKQDRGITYTRYISGFVSMARIDTLMNLIIAVVVIFLINPSLQVGHWTAWKILTLLFVIFLLGPILFELLFNKLKIKNPKLLWIHTKLSEVLRITGTSLRDFPFLCKFFLLGVLLFFRTVYVFQLYFGVLGISASFDVLTIFYTLFKLSFFISLTPGNLGIQELAWGYLSDQMNIGMGQGILMSGLVRVVSSLVLFVIGMIFGGYDLIRQRKKYLAQSTGDEKTSEVS